MKNLPQRISLVVQTADILREQINSAQTEYLPGERELCAQLRISRPTVRAALELLRREGLIAVAHGRRRRIRQAGTSVRRNISNSVGLLTPVPLHRMPPFVMFWVDELRERLADEGFDLQLQVIHAAEAKHPEKLIERLAVPVAWLLYLSTETMQRWFAARGLPCVIIGSRFPDLPLPSVDIDSFATCRHAAGMFTAKGHRRMAILLPDTGTAGDQASADGFLAGVAGTKSDIRALVVRHDETVPDVIRKLDGLIAGSFPTTALLVARSVHALTALTHLQRRGLKLPRDMTFISRDNDPFLDFVLPRVARYCCDPSTFARRVSRVVLQLTKEGAVPARQILLMPELSKGETIGPPPSPGNSHIER